MACYSYIADISDAESRTRRIAFLDGVFPIGFYVGNTLAAIVRKRLGFMYNFSFAMVFAGLAALYCILFVKDSRIQRDQRLKKELEGDIKKLDVNDKARAKLQEDLDNLERSGQVQESRTVKDICQDFFQVTRDHD